MVPLPTLMLMPFTQSGVLLGVPAQLQPPACTTSLVVFGLPSLQGEPTVAGNAGLLGWQSKLLQTPSPSVSPPWLAHGFGGVPAQLHPPACTTSLVVFGLPSLQGEPTVAGNAGLLGWQSKLLQTPSPSVSPPWLAHGFGGVPAQLQPPACTTSLVVFGLPSLQGEPTAAGNAGLLGWQSKLLQTPSPSVSPP